MSSDIKTKQQDDPVVAVEKALVEGVLVELKSPLCENVFLRNGVIFITSSGETLPIHGWKKRLRGYAFSDLIDEVYKCVIKQP